MGKKFQQMNGEKWPDFQARIRAAQTPKLTKPKRVRRKAVRPATAPCVDPDGFDRDNLGLSPDY